MHPERDDLLVVRAVEDPDPAPLGERLVDAPQEVVVEVLARRLLEGDDLHPLRVHARHHVLDRRVLAGGVERLEHHEERVRVARPEQLLRVRELLHPLLQDLLRGALQLLGPRAARTPCPPSRRDLARPTRPACPGLDEQPLHDAFTSLHRRPSCPATASDAIVRIPRRVSASGLGEPGRPTRPPADEDLDQLLDEHEARARCRCRSTTARSVSRPSRRSAAGTRSPSRP